MSKGAIHVARLFCGAAGLALAAASAVHAQSPANQTYNIPPKPLAAALEAFAAQSHEQILATGDLVAGKTSPGASGASDAPTALSRLLEGTGLTYRRSGRIFLIIKASSPGLPITRIADHAAEPAVTTVPAAAPEPVKPAPETAQLGELVVTATRQSNTVNKVALSIAAVSQQALDREGVKNIQDISRTVPSLTFRVTGGDSVPNVAIRGISSAIGASTTGYYLDDIPLAKVGWSAAVSGGGSPIPQLFDLDRVEVLRGPQGTLFGASSEGGTIRFLTPQPSLTTYSGYARSEVSGYETGGVNYEGGVAVGGPIVMDKLGFRASLWDRHTAGYIDAVSLYDGHTFGNDLNSGDQRTARVVVTWAPTNRLKITPSFYYSQDYSADNDSYWFDIPQYTVNSGIFTNVVTFGAGANKFNLDFPNKAFTGGTYGPFNQYGLYKRGTGVYLDEQSNAVPATSPRTTNLYATGFNVDYDFDAFDFKSISSYLYDNTFGHVRGTNGIRTGVAYTTTNAAFVTAAGTPVPNGMGTAPLFIPGYPTLIQDFQYINQQRSITQEFRFSSKPSDSRLSWVGGLYFNRNAQRQFGSVANNENDVSNYLRGIDEAYALGTPPLTGTVFNPGNPPVAPEYYKVTGGPTTVNGLPTYTAVQTQQSIDADIARRYGKLAQTEYAAYGEVNYMITDKLKATAGVRYSDFEYAYLMRQGGSVNGPPLPVFTPTPTHVFPNQPGDLYYNDVQGKVQEHPVNPKFGLSYQVTPTDLLYVTASKGYRSGGVNPAGTYAQCAPDLAAIGRPTPLTYTSDSVWSYEGGAKIRLFNNHMQLNSSAFYIDWQDPQLTVRLQCGFTYVTNAKNAVSKGGDIDTQIRLFDGFTFNGSVSYTNAYYASDFDFPTPTGALTYVVKKGGSLGIPVWQYNVGGQYDFRVFDRSSYVRLDYQYSSSYQRGSAAGTIGYVAQTVYGAPTHYMTGRAGMRFDGYEASLFVNNLLDSHDILNETVGAQSPLVTANTFRPREVGLQLSYRF